MIVTPLVAATLLAFAAVGSPCIIETNPTYVPPSEALSQTVSRPGCFNPRQALYERWPLLYQIHSQKCRYFCNKLNGVTPCPSTPAVVAAGAPPASAPTPARAPVPTVEECPACAANALNQVRPEILRYLFGDSAPSCPCCAQQ